MSYTITETTKIDHEEKPQTYYVTPCGQEIPKVQIKYDWNGNPNKPKKTRKTVTSEDIIKTHCETCIECKIIVGKSKQRILTQQQVANLFGLGIDDKTSGTGLSDSFKALKTGNFYSENGYLYHYGTIQAIRTIKGLIIVNSECWSRGFAHCSVPRHVNAYLDLTTLDDHFHFKEQEMRNLEILDTAKGEYERANATLFRIETRYFLNGRNEDGHGTYVAELIEPANTIAEAFETMKPKSVKNAIANGLNVQRQGELFFVRLTGDETGICGIEKRTKELVTVYYKQCSNCGIKTRESEEKDDWQIRDHPESGYGWQGWRHSKNAKLRKAYECYTTHKDADKFMKLKHRKKIKFSPYPTISGYERHTATMTAQLYTTQLVKGIVRHTNRDHHALKLGNGNEWYIVIANTVKNAFSAGVRGGRD